MNKTDFLKAICGKSVLRTIDGLEVEIRSLTVLETQELAGKSELEATLTMCQLGLVVPKLDPEDAKELGKANPGFIMKLAKEISTLSGLVDTDSPTVGNG